MSAGVCNLLVFEVEAQSASNWLNRLKLYADITGAEQDEREAELKPKE